MSMSLSPVLYMQCPVSISPTTVATVSFTQSAHNVTEGDGNVNICITVSSVPAGGMEQDLIVSLQFTSGSIAGEIVYNDLMFEHAVC